MIVQFSAGRFHDSYGGHEGLRLACDSALNGVSAGEDNCSWVRDRRINATRTRRDRDHAVRLSWN